MFFIFFQALQSFFSCRGNIQQKFRIFLKKVLFLKPFLKQNISAEKEKTFLRSEGVIMEGHAQEEMKEDFIAAFKLNSNSTQTWSRANLKVTKLGGTLLKLAPALSRAGSEDLSGTKSSCQYLDACPRKFSTKS